MDLGGVSPLPKFSPEAFQKITSTMPAKLVALGVTTRPVVIHDPQGHLAGASPLEMAIYSNDLEKFKELLNERGSEAVNSRMLDGGTLLHAAAWSERSEFTKELLARHANVDARDRFNSTPLHYANTREVVQLLVKAGANLRSENILGYLPLHTAIQVDHPAAVAELLNLQVDPNSKTSRSISPLHLAAGRGDKECVACLLRHGAEASAKTEMSQTPLMLAANPEVAEALLKAGCPLDARDGLGYTALHEAVRHRHEALVEYLIKRGANVNAKSKSGWTPLLVAASTRQERMVTMLLKAHCSPLVLSPGGETAADIAAKNGDDEILELLRAADSQLTEDSKDQGR